MRCIRVAAAAALVSIVLAPNALARNDVVQISVEYVRENADQGNVLQGISWHMNGERHRGVAERFPLATTTKTTNATFKSDEDACARAFLSGIIQLQRRARSLGADGVVDIKSTANGQTYDKPESFGCTAGNVLARVSLTGVPVKFK